MYTCVNAYTRTCTYLTSALEVLLRGHKHVKTGCFEVVELLFACVSCRFQVVGEGLVTNERIRKGTLMFRNVLITVVSVLV